MGMLLIIRIECKGRRSDGATQIWLAAEVTELFPGVLPMTLNVVAHDRIQVMKSPRPRRASSWSFDAAPTARWAIIHMDATTLRGF
jgi:hypothetical protein